MTFRFPSDSPASQARLARAIEKERAARMPKTTRGTAFEDHLRAIGHPAAAACKRCGQVACGQTGEYPCKLCGLPTLHDAPTTPPQDPRAQEQAALVPELKAGDLVMVEDNGNEAPWVPRHLLYLDLDGDAWCKNMHQANLEKEFPTHEEICWGKPRLPTPAERAQSGGWIEHDGKDAIMPARTKIEWKARDGRSAICTWGELGGKTWNSASPRENDIVAYKVLQP